MLSCSGLHDIPTAACTWDTLRGTNTQILVEPELLQIQHVLLRDTAEFKETDTSKPDTVVSVQEEEMTTTIGTGEQYTALQERSGNG